MVEFLFILLLGGSPLQRRLTVFSVFIICVVLYYKNVFWLTCEHLNSFFAFFSKRLFPTHVSHYFE